MSMFDKSHERRNTECYMLSLNIMGLCLHPSFEVKNNILKMFHKFNMVDAFSTV